ncbi:tRNA-uridine aminocarboxypropyltransferase [Salinivibrio sp. ES.052]|uniref:tRNA-uridine aminocarboxypropyltransferase n=1 Tax=Salinivibrio sp. ES.052 TaxID=1882823 RepID=UPI000927859D|nr:tRNA-uridine aminocarboxypropyltransferase [Salinivibrio sp. ES.052]SIN76812.1 DTW domain-containing protein YfiP [Salinivibrio sp. ES.052]
MSRYCSSCHKAKAICVCDAITPITNSIPVIILQHPDEVSHPKNSACLLSLALDNCERWIGENFSEHGALNETLAQTQRRYAVLYPGEHAISLSSLTEQPVEDNNRERPWGIILLDGTWKKAYKMYQLSKNLHDLPTVNITPMSPSQYTIRKSAKLGALSTLEAGFTALSELSGNSEHYQPLLASFETMIARQLAFMPSSHSTNRPSE